VSWLQKAISATGSAFVLNAGSSERNSRTNLAGTHGLANVLSLRYLGQAPFSWHWCAWWSGEDRTGEEKKRALSSSEHLCTAAL